MMNRTSVVLMALAFACGTGCGDDTSSTARSVDEVIGQLNKAGMKTSSFKSLDGTKLGDGACKRGTVSRIETTLCRYTSDEKAASAKPAGLSLVGRVTGASLVAGKLLLVVADRNKIDPSGRVINRITRVFRGRADGNSK